MTRTVWAILAFLAAVAFGASSFIVPDIGGFEADQFPIPQQDPPVQPARYAFAIWGPIYLGLIAHAGFGLWKRRNDPVWDGLRLPLTLSLVIGAPWLMVANQNPPAATAMIWAMLLSALWAFFKTSNTQDRWLLQLPVAVYAGWLSAASFVAMPPLPRSALGLISPAIASWASVNSESSGMCCAAESLCGSAV